MRRWAFTERIHSKIRYKFNNGITGGTEYIYKMLTALPTDMNGTARTPAAGHFFNV